MNWGAKIAVLYGGFVILIVSLVTGTFYNKSELVAGDYYHKETIFQQQLNAEQAARSLGEPLQLQLSAGILRLRFPASLAGQEITGTAHFYAPANASADRSISMDSIREGKWSLSRDKLANANYEVQVSWTAAGKNYYQALPLNLLP
jgi:hypothetical protein